MVKHLQLSIFPIAVLQKHLKNMCSRDLGSETSTIKNWPIGGSSSPEVQRHHLRMFLALGRRPAAAFARHVAAAQRVDLWRLGG